MPTREIPRAEWNAFFETFSKQHEGWLATVEVLGEEIGAQEEAHELPLVGITADLKGSDADAVSIIVGKRAEDHITHTITAMSGSTCGDVRPALQNRKNAATGITSSQGPIRRSPTNQ